MFRPAVGWLYTLHYKHFSSYINFTIITNLEGLYQRTSIFQVFAFTIQSPNILDYK